MSEGKKARVGVILGSGSDLRLVNSCRETLEKFNEPYELIIGSAHRTPKLVQQWVEGAEKRGIKVIIAAAGAAAALPGVVAAHTVLPVVGLPLDTTQLRGVDSLYAIVQMPPGIPVATVGINNGDNAALMALSILGASDDHLRRKLHAYRRALEEKVFKANRELYEENPQLRPGKQHEAEQGEEQAALAVKSVEEPLHAIETPAALLQPASSEEDDGPVYVAQDVSEEEFAELRIPRTTMPHGVSRRLTIDPMSPSPEAIERAVDILMDGGVVALPTDTVYGLAADATRPEAVRKLYQIKNRPEIKAIPLLIHNTRLLASIASEMPQDIMPVLERYWPGPLTLVLRKYAGSFEVAAPGATVGIRIPNNPIALAVLAMINRPLAVSSANMAGGTSARTADAIEEIFGDRVDLILDAGPVGQTPESTILDVSMTPFRVLREGAVSRGELQELLGEGQLQ